MSRIVLARSRGKLARDNRQMGCSASSAFTSQRPDCKFRQARHRQQSTGDLRSSDLD